MKKLSKKQKGFADDYINTRNGTKSAQQNYIVKTENTAAAIAYENLRKPHIENYIASVLTDELLSTKHLALLNKMDESGNIDVQAVKAGLDMGYKIKGSYAAEKRTIELDLTDIKNKDDAELAKLAGLES